MSLEDAGRVNALLRSAQEEERLQGLREVALRHPEAALRASLDALGDESWRVRKEATELFLAQPAAERLSAEVVEMLHAEENAGLRNAAVEILTRLGAAAVPSLLDELACTDPDVRKFALDILGDIGDASCCEAMLLLLDDPDANVRAATAENLGKLGGPEATPALLRAMERPDLWFRFTVLEALGVIGAPVSLEELLPYRRDRMLRKALFDCLGRVGDVDALPVLIEGLVDEMAPVRAAAAVALALVVESRGPQDDALLASLAGSPTADALAALLDDDDQAVRLAAAKVLGWVGDGRYAGRLLDLFEDDRLRDTAATALISMGGEAVCPLLDRWSGAGLRTRAYLAYVFGEAACVEASASLLEALSAPEPELRLTAARAVGKLALPEGVAPLATLLGDPSEEVREGALEALSVLGGSCLRETLAVLQPLLEDDDPGLRMYAVLVHGVLDDPRAVERLAFALKDESPQVRQAAVRSLAAKGTDQLQALELALTDEDADVRRLAAEALGAVGSVQALLSLELALRDEDLWVRSAAVRALGHFPADRAFALAQSCLSDPVGLVCIAALETLAALDNPRAHRELVAALDHDDEEVVNAALKLLAAGGRRDWIAPITERLLNHRHWEVRTTFARTFAQLEGQGSREYLEQRLLVEGEPLVQQQLRDLIDRLATVAGDG